MTREQLIMMASIGVYMAAVLVIGIFYSKRSKTTSDFYLGGRKLSPLVAAMSAEASDMSSWLLMGLPGVAYVSGLADAGWTAIGLAVGTYFNWLIVAKRLRRYTMVAKNSITLPDFFSNRFHDKSKILMSVSALVILVFFVPYTASGFAACGKLFHNLLGIDYKIAMIVSALVVVLYTAIGGFLAESISDLIQGILMSFALVIIMVFGISSAGGIDGVIANAEKMPGFLSMFETFNSKTGTASPYGFITIISTCAWGLGYFGMPHVLLRFMAIRKENELKHSRRIAMVWVVISLIAAVFIGIIGSAAIKGLGDPETIFIELAKKLGGQGFILLLFAGVILAGVLAATMSTSDSQLLVASSGISQNFFKGILHKNASDKLIMWISRITIIIIAIISVIIALDENSSIFSIVSFAWAGFGAAFGPVVLFSLFWKRTTLYGALAGMLSGGVVIFIWKFLIKPIGGIFNIYELLPAFIVAALMIVIVSLLNKEPSKEIQDEFDLVASAKPID
ncbi:MAG: sodium/proline symporter PutP [Oscillospiraceae bacterium]|nr:sodium/proline symporter PutP [Oscillospiraceae bacterium]MDD3832421.1 sodium/proline symporter PutP [Oscillospiraceae bacterium]MDD4546766.1 sodium/proline symporter PutP [Oscillospiraceae bacterium]